MFQGQQPPARALTSFPENIELELDWIPMPKARIESTEMRMAGTSGNLPVMFYEMDMKVDLPRFFFGQNSGDVRIVDDRAMFDNRFVMNDIFDGDLRVSGKTMSGSLVKAVFLDIRFLGDLSLKTMWMACPILTAVLIALRHNRASEGGPVKWGDEGDSFHRRYLSLTATIDNGANTAYISARNTMDYNGYFDEMQDDLRKAQSDRQEFEAVYEFARNVMQGVEDNFIMDPEDYNSIWTTAIETDEGQLDVATPVVRTGRITGIVLKSVLSNVGFRVRNPPPPPPLEVQARLLDVPFTDILPREEQDIEDLLADYNFNL